MKTTGASENPTRSTRSSRIKWHHLYFLLAAFAVFTVSFSLVLIHRLVATHKRAVEGNFQWVARLQLCDNLGKNAAVVAASGTDALKQHDPDAAALKMRGAFSDFSEKLNSLRDEMNRNVPPTDAAQLLRHCATVRKEIGDVVERSDSIFSLVRTGKFDEAGKQGVTLSRDYNDVLEELNRFRVDIRAVRKTYMEAQTIEASKLAAYEWWLGGLILVLVAGITIYGVKLERHMSIAAARLRESEERYRTLFDSIDEGFCIIEMIFDEQGKPVDYRFLEISPSFEKQTGLIGAQGKRMRELAPQHEAYWFEIYGRIALTGQPGRFQNRAEQLHRWYDVYAFRFGDPKNRQVAILFNDITERRRDEEKILKLNDELARQAAQLEAANKELEAFSYSVSHDLRAPVRYIDGFADLLQKHSGASLNEKGRRYLNTISESAKQMGALINDLLSFSRTGRAELRKTTVSLGDLLKEVVNGLSQETEGREVVWSFGALPEVEADPSMLRQVLVNLVSNALKYSRTRKPARIEIGCQSQNGDTVFSIRDNGVGFDMQYADKLFGVFQRLHDASEFEGTGIGLANVRRIIQRHGGKVWAEGETDKGATFYFSLKNETRNEATGLSQAMQICSPSSAEMEPSVAR